jgi:solute carrier family 25 (mitochondrial oxoglutarate transporter), member 11
LFRYSVGGWGRPFGAFDYAFKRKIPGALFAAAITAPISVPFEVARMAYYADKTFP